MPTDDLPTEVLTELGRVTWAAIKLEDYVESVCSWIDPSNPRTDRRQVGQKIKDANKVLAQWLDSPTRREANAWLERAHKAIKRRNATLHATPLVWIGPDRPDAAQLLLGEMPRNGRPYVERPLTVEALAELRSVLDGATGGWRDLVAAIDAETTRQKSVEQ